MSRPMIVVLVGVDGSGKTTHAKWLAGWLDERGAPARYFENGGGRPVLDALAHRLGRADGRALLGRGGYLAIEATLRWIGVARAVVLSRLTGRVGVMDRWTYCQYVIMRARGDRGERLVRAAYALFPRPDLVCFLAVPPQVAQRRVLERGRDVEELSHLVALDEAYRSLPEAAAFTVIGAGRESDQVRAALTEAVNRHFGRRRT